MKHANLIVFPFLFLILLFFQGCNKKQEEKNPFQPPGVVLQKHNTSAQNLSDATYYRLSNEKNETLRIAIDKNNIIYFDRDEPSIVLFTFFSPWSYPCKSQLAYLADLQKYYPSKLTIIGIMLNPHNQTAQLSDFIQEIHAGFFIAQGKENNTFTRHMLKSLHLPDFMPVPLTVMYHNGIYSRHYEGAVPIEMIEHDIKTIMK